MLYVSSISIKERDLKEKQLKSCKLRKKKEKDDSLFQSAVGGENDKISPVMLDLGQVEKSIERSYESIFRGTLAQQQINRCLVKPDFYT